MSRRAYKVNLQHGLRHDFVLQAEVVVIDVRIVYALREDDSRQVSGVGVLTIPAIDIASRLSSRALVGVGWSTRVGRGNTSRPVERATSRRAANTVNAVRRAPNDRLAGTDKLVVFQVKRVVWQVPARVRERIVERALVRDAETATH